MSKTNLVSSQVVDAVKLGQSLTMGTEIAYAQGDGMAYQIVAQASANAVADAGNYLRNISALSMAAMAAMTTRMAESGDVDTWQDAMREVQQSTKDAADVFEKVGKTSAHVMRAFQNIDKDTSSSS